MLITMVETRFRGYVGLGLKARLLVERVGGLPDFSSSMVRCDDPEAEVGEERWRAKGRLWVDATWLQGIAAKHYSQEKSTAWAVMLQLATMRIPPSRRSREGATRAMPPPAKCYP